MAAIGNGSGGYMSDLVSVIVPIYKVEDYLEECIESIISQSYDNLEIILVDDGSPDDCPVICDRYASRDDRIKVIHKKNGGLSDARNAGIEASSGQWLAFIDSDDWISIFMIERLLAACKSYDAKLAWCNILEMDIDGFIIGRDASVLYKEYSYNEDISYITYTNSEAENRFYSQEGMQKALVAWNKLYHRSLFEPASGPIRYAVGKIFEDGYTTYKLIYQSETVVEVLEPLYYYRQRGGSIMNKAGKVQYKPGLEAGIERMDFYLAHGERELYLKELNYDIHLAIHYYESVGSKREKKDVKSWFAIMYKQYFTKEKWPLGRRVRMKAFLMNYSLYKFISAFEGVYNKLGKKS